MSRMGGFFAAAKSEADRANTMHGGFTNIHEAYAVLLEEVDEFWELVRLKKIHREPYKVREELVQIAAMCGKAYEALMDGKFTSQYVSLDGHLLSPPKDEVQ